MMSGSGKFLIMSICILLICTFQFYRTRQPFWIVNIGLGVVMVIFGVIGLWWHPIP
jgi:hypothetical protein